MRREVRKAREHVRHKTRDAQEYVGQDGNRQLVRHVVQKAPFLGLLVIRRFRLHLDILKRIFLAHCY